LLRGAAIFRCRCEGAQRPKQSPYLTIVEIASPAARNDRLAKQSPYLTIVEIASPAARNDRLPKQSPNLAIVEIALPAARNDRLAKQSPYLAIVEIASPAARNDRLWRGSAKGCGNWKEKGKNARFPIVLWKLSLYNLCIAHFKYPFHIL